MRDSVLIITASTGIGAATARLAARQGAKLFVISRTEANCVELTDELTETGETCAFAVADVAEETQVNAAVAECVKTYGRIDALYNVAGISGSKFGDGPIHTCTPQGWDAVMGVNLRGMYLVSRAVINQMLTQTPQSNGLRGSVLNMASVLGQSPYPEHFTTHAYAASKAAILGLTKSMAGYYAPHHIRINAIAPGLTATPMAGRATQDATLNAAMQRKQPLRGGVLEPGDVAEASWFLLSNASRAITGDTLIVDGGWSVTG
ncbi:MAG: SDR family oxidoreductase [Planctomycetota bacterium]